MAVPFGEKDTRQIDELRQTIGEIAQRNMRNRMFAIQSERDRQENQMISGILETHRRAIQGTPTSQSMLVDNPQFGDTIGVQSSLPEMRVSPEQERQSTINTVNDLLAIGTPKSRQSAQDVMTMYKETRDPQAKTEFEGYLKLYGNDYGKAIGAYRKARVEDRIRSQSRGERDRAPNKWDLLNRASRRDQKGNPTPDAVTAQRALDLEKSEESRGDVLRTETDAKGNKYEVRGYKDVDGNEIITGYKTINKAATGKSGFNINDPSVRKMFGLDEGGGGEATGDVKQPKQQYKKGDIYTNPAGKKWKYLGGNATEESSWEEQK